MFKTLYMLRHGETDWNDQWRLQGQRDIPLSHKGTLQAEKAANRLKKLEIHKIYCSDLSRAVKTAEIIAEALGGEIHMQKTENLREISFGNWEGKRYEDISIEEKEEYEHWLKDPVTVSVPGGETIHDVKVRVNGFLNRILEEKENNILVVTHGGPVKVLVSQALNMNLSYLSRLTVSPAALSIIQYYRQYPYLVLFNDVCHLGDKK